MLTTDMVYETGYFGHADADHLADLWNRAYPQMREIATLYVENWRAYIQQEGWIIDPSLLNAEVLQAYATPEKKARRKLKSAEDLRRELGQLDRGTHRPCTRSPGRFSVTAAYVAVRNLITISSLGTEGMSSIFLLAAELAGAEERVNRVRKGWQGKVTQP